MWSLRDALSRWFVRWPWLAALTLLGAALGWGAARLSPPRYRAVAEMYVGLHAYRAPQEQNRNPSSYYDFRNLDDFKNWQLEQLDQFVRRDALVRAVLTRLRAQDAAWETVSPAALQAMLSPRWRTVGKWQLTAEAPAARMAEQAAETWRAVTLEALETAMQSAAEVMRLDVEMQAVAAEQAALTRRAARLESARSGLQAWRAAAQGRPPDAPSDAAERWRLQALAAQASAFTPGWQALMAAFPAADAPLSRLLAWSAPALAAVEREQAALPAQQEALRTRFEALQAQYRQANAESYGLSLNLSLDGIASAPVRAQAVRSPGGWVLTGAALGLLTGLLAWLVGLGWEETARG